MPRELGGTPQSQDPNVRGEALADAAATVLQKPGKPESGDHRLQNAECHRGLQARGWATTTGDR